MSRAALVVDDSMLIRHTVCRYLEERGFAVESASNGAEALNILGHFTPDLVITDLEMPKMTGSEFITKLKASDLTATLPIIVLSARRSVDVMPDENRADYVIFKNIDILSQLETALDIALGSNAWPVS